MIDDRYDQQQANSPPNTYPRSRYSSKYFLANVLFLFLLGCCHKKGLREKAVGLGINPEMHEKLMIQSPLYRYFLEGGHDYQTETAQFLKRIKRKYKPKQLEQWAQKLLQAHSEETDLYHVRQEDLPNLIKKLDPPVVPFVTVLPKSHVVVDWGGGFGHWGLFLGQGSPSSNNVLYVLEWVPGIKAFHTIQ